MYSSITLTFYKYFSSQYNNQLEIMYGPPERRWRVPGSFLPSHQEASSLLTCKLAPFSLGSLLPTNNYFNDFMPPTIMNSMFLPDCTEEEILKIISELQNGKSSDIPISVIKKCSPVLSPILAKRFNHLMTIGEFPDTISSNTGIHKEGGGLHSPTETLADTTSGLPAGTTTLSELLKLHSQNSSGQLMA